MNNYTVRGMRDCIVLLDNGHPVKVAKRTVKNRKAYLAGKFHLIFGELPCKSNKTEA